MPLMLDIYTEYFSWMRYTIAAHEWILPFYINMIVTFKCRSFECAHRISILSFRIRKYSWRREREREKAPIAFSIGFNKFDWWSHCPMTVIAVEDHQKEWRNLKKKIPKNVDRKRKKSRTKSTTTIQTKQSTCVFLLFWSIRDVCIWFTTCQIVFHTCCVRYFYCWLLQHTARFHRWMMMTTTTDDVCSIGFIVWIRMCVSLFVFVAGYDCKTLISLFDFVISCYLRSAISITYIFLRVSPFIYLVVGAHFRCCYCCCFVARCSLDHHCLFVVFIVFIYLHNEIVRGWFLLRIGMRVERALSIQIKCPS